MMRPEEKCPDCGQRKRADAKQCDDCAYLAYRGKIGGGRYPFGQAISVRAGLFSQQFAGYKRVR